jgi:hypothetical protein
VLWAIWSLIQHIWLIKVVWIIFATIVNIGAIIVSYNLFRGDVNFRNTFPFFPLLLLLVGLPLFINSCLVDSLLARNIFLPIYLTEFVDLQGDQRMIGEKIPRNFVFFTLICAFL